MDEKKLNLLYDLYLENEIISDQTSREQWMQADENQVNELYKLGVDANLFETTTLEEFSSAFFLPSQEDTGVAPSESLDGDSPSPSEETQVFDGITYATSDLEEIKKLYDEGFAESDLEKIKEAKRRLKAIEEKQVAPKEKLILSPSAEGSERAIEFLDPSKFQNLGVYEELPERYFTEKFEAFSRDADRVSYGEFTEDISAAILNADNNVTRGMQAAEKSVYTGDEFRAMMTSPLISEMKEKKENRYTILPKAYFLPSKFKELDARISQANKEAGLTDEEGISMEDFFFVNKDDADKVNDEIVIYGNRDDPKRYDITDRIKEGETVSLEDRRRIALSNFIMRSDRDEHYDSLTEEEREDPNRVVTDAVFKGFYPSVGARPAPMDVDRVVENHFSRMVQDEFESNYKPEIKSEIESAIPESVRGNQRVLDAFDTHIYDATGIGFNISGDHQYNEKPFWFNVGDRLQIGGKTFVSPFTTLAKSIDEGIAPTEASKLKAKERAEFRQKMEYRDKGITDLIDEGDYYGAMAEIGNTALEAAPQVAGTILVPATRAGRVGLAAYTGVSAAESTFGDISLDPRFAGLSTWEKLGYAGRTGVIEGLSQGVFSAITRGAYPKIGGKIGSKIDNLIQPTFEASKRYALQRAGLGYALKTGIAGGSEGLNEAMTEYFNYINEIGATGEEFSWSDAGDRMLLGLGAGITMGSAAAPTGFISQQAKNASNAFDERARMYQAHINTVEINAIEKKLKANKKAMDDAAEKGLDPKSAQIMPDSELNELINRRLELEKVRDVETEAQIEQLEDFYSMMQYRHPEAFEEVRTAKNEIAMLIGRSKRKGITQEEVDVYKGRIEERMKEIQDVKSLYRNESIELTDQETGRKVYDQHLDAVERLDEDITLEEQSIDAMEESLTPYMQMIESGVEVPVDLDQMSQRIETKRNALEDKKRVQQELKDSASKLDEAIKSDDVDAIKEAVVEVNEKLELLQPKPEPIDIEAMRPDDQLVTPEVDPELADIPPIVEPEVQTEVDANQYRAINENDLNREAAERLVDNPIRSDESLREELVSDLKSYGRTQSKTLRGAAKKIGNKSDLPQSKREEILQNKELYFDPVKISEIGDKIKFLSDEDLVSLFTDDAIQLAATDANDLQIAPLAMMEMINRVIERKDFDKLDPLIEKYAKLGTVFGRGLRMYGELKKSTPAGSIMMFENAMAKSGNQMTEAQRDKAIKLITEDFEIQRKYKKLLDEAVVTGEPPKGIKQAKKDRIKSAKAVQTFKNSMIEEDLSDILLSIITGNLFVPNTHAVNTVSNMVGLGLFILRDAFLTMPIEKLLNVLKIPSNNPRSWALIGYLGAVGKFASSAFRSTASAVKGDPIVSERTAEWDQYKGLFPLRSALTLIARRDDLPMNSKMRKSVSQQLKLALKGFAPTAYTADINFRALNVGDIPFREFAEYIFTYQVGLKRGKKGKDLLNFVKYPPKKVWEEAQKVGAEITFQQDSTTARMTQETVDLIVKMSGSVMDRAVGGKGLGLMDGDKLAKLLIRGSQFVFVKTPANMTQELFLLAFPGFSLLSGLGYAKAGDARMAADRFAKAIMGTIIINLTMRMIYHGFYSPPLGWDDEDRRKRMLLNRTKGVNTVNRSALKRYFGGMPAPEAAKYVPGDDIISIERLGPLGTLMHGVGLSYNKEELMKQGPDAFGFGMSKAIGQAFGADSYAAATSMLEQSFLQGPNNIMRVLQSKKEEDLNGALAKLSQSTYRAFSGLVFPNAMKSFSRYNTEYLPERPYDKDQSWTDQLINVVQYNFYEKMGAEDQYPPQVNWLGEKVKMTPEGSDPMIHLIDPIKKREGTDDPVYVEMLRLLEESGQLPAVVNVSGAAGKKKQSVPSRQTGKRGEAVRKYNRERENNGLSPITFMGDEEFKKLSISFDQRARLEIAEMIGKERRSRVEELIQTDEYKKMPSDAQLEALKKIQEDFNGLIEITKGRELTEFSKKALDEIQRQYEEWSADQNK
jgi:hypothetical protein